LHLLPVAGRCAGLLPGAILIWQTKRMAENGKVMGFIYILNGKS
jgi:hypothetical protein